MSLRHLILLKLNGKNATDLGDLQRMLHGANKGERQVSRLAVETYDPGELEALQVNSIESVQGHFSYVCPPHLMCGSPSPDWMS